MCTATRPGCAVAVEQGTLLVGVAIAEHDELCATRKHRRQRGKHQVDAFLPGEAAHHTEEQGARCRREPQALAKQCAIFLARGAVPDVEVRGQLRVGRRIPHGVVDAVQDAAQHMRAMPQQAVEAHAAFGRADLFRISRRHGGDPVGEREPAFEETYAAVILDAVDRPRMPRQAERIERDAAVLPLEREVVHGHDRGGPRAAVVMQIRGGEPRLPIVRVHDIGHEIGHHAVAHIRGGAR
jgi:hypothetical protein